MIMGRRVTCLALLLALVACREEKKPSSSNKRARLEEAMAQGAKEQSAVATFANALREVIDWRQTQPAMNEALVREVLARLEKLPAQDLPQDLAKPWSQVVNAWQARAKGNADDKAGTQAAQGFNAALAARGIIDVRL